MKRLALSTVFCLLTTLAVAGLWQRGDDVRTLNDDGAWLKKGWQPVQVSQSVSVTNSVIVTNDVTEAALRTYLIANKPAGVTASSTPAQIRTAWSDAVAAASTANKPAVLGEQSIWVAAWMLYRTLPDALPDFTTNTSVTVTNVYAPRTLQ